MMKYCFFLLLLSTTSFCQNYHYTLGKESISEPPPERNEINIFLKEIFENNNLELKPNLSDFYPELIGNHSFSLEKNIKKAGNSAGRFEINKTDTLLWGGYRAEMAQVRSTTKEEGWYGFSQYFPDTYITDPSSEVVAQWHVQPDAGEYTARSPSNAIITSNNRIRWMLRWDADRIMTDGYSDGHIYIDLGEIPKNKWIDWVVHIKYSHTNTGILEVWKDGIKVIDRQNMPNTYNDEAYPYFKFGVYKWEWGNIASQRVIYYDEVRVGNKNSSYEDVKPGSN